MYSYTKKKRVPKRKLIVALSTLLVIAVAFMSYEYSLQQEQDTAVFKDEHIPVLQLPSNAVVEKGKKPFAVDAKVVLDFFDGKDSEVESITEFEGVYRGNQGMDYALDGEAFDIQACFSGKVSDVKDDAIFGKSVSITSEDLTITYQSLEDISVKKGDNIQQGQVFAKAGSNIYNKDLGNHLHIVCQKTDKIIDPELIYESSIQDIK